MNSDFELADTVALVTGGTKGIGRVIATRLADHGATIVVCARTPPEEPIELPTGTATFIQCDVRDAEALPALVDQVVAKHGRIDLLVNNAGGGPPTEAATASARRHGSIIELNLTAPLHMSQAVSRVMFDQPGGGHIINITSMTGARAAPGAAAYGAAKAGLMNLTQSLAVEWGPTIRVNSVVAGAVITPDAMPFYGGEEGLAAIAAQVPLGRLAEPLDVANAVVLLASPLATYVNGANLELHGGGEAALFSQKS